MRLWTTPFGIAALAAPMLLATPSEARTAFQYFAQGRGAYVSSTDHPPGGLQDALLGYGARPLPAEGYYEPRGHLPPPGYRPDYDDEPGY